MLQIRSALVAVGCGTARGIQTGMPVYRDKAKGRWRFTFNRVVDGERFRATRLLPPAWDRATCEKWAHKEEGSNHWSVMILCV